MGSGGAGALEEEAEVAEVVEAERVAVVCPPRGRGVVCQKGPFWRSIGESLALLVHPFSTSCGQGGSSWSLLGAYGRQLSLSEDYVDNFD